LSADQVNLTVTINGMPMSFYLGDHVGAFYSAWHGGNQVEVRVDQAPTVTAVAANTPAPVFNVPAPVVNVTAPERTEQDDESELFFKEMDTRTVSALERIADALEQKGIDSAPLVNHSAVQRAIERRQRVSRTTGQEHQEG
jgi:hypothetical protein